MGKQRYFWMLAMLGVGGISVVGGILVLRAHCPACQPHETDAAVAELPGQPLAVDPPLPEIDPKLIRYEEVAEIPTGCREVHALATGPADEIYVGGDKRLASLTPDGKKLWEVPLGGVASAAAAGHAPPGRVYVAIDNHVEVFDSSGKRIAVWEPPGKKSLLTSIAAGDEHVFVADAGERIVWRYEPDGRRRTRIGDRDPARKIPGFLLSSLAYFDLGIGADGLVYVVNPMALRLEGYTPDGDLETTWGRGSASMDEPAAFYGCCNPAHFVVLPDGRFVTAEKGFPRIKLYSRQGKFECVVAGPRQVKHTAAALAADRQGRVLVLDASSASVRIFAPKKDGSGGEP